MSPAITDVYSQLTFYGAYHNNKYNILIHVLCVPWLLWSGQLLSSRIPVPDFIPNVHYAFNEYLAFDLNITSILTAAYLTYYFILEPVAAALYTPQMVLSLLTATAFSYRKDAISTGVYVQVVAWILQFLGHGVAEKRAPALVDNLLGAVVLAPFFVHIETLFKLGYRPEMAKRLQNDISVELVRVRRNERLAKEAKGK